MKVNPIRKLTYPTRDLIPMIEFMRRGHYLMVVSYQFERLLFTEGVIPKSQSLQTFFHSINPNLVIIVRDEPECFISEIKSTFL